MPIVYVVLYALVALFFFFMGKITAEPEDRDAFLATLASLLWPLAMIVVLISVIYSSRPTPTHRWSGRPRALPVPTPRPRADPSGVIY